MKRASRTSLSDCQHQTLPLEIYLPLVTSLYKDGRTLLVGTIVVTRVNIRHILEDRRRLTIVMCRGICPGRLRARNIGLGLREHAPNNNKRRTRQAMGASLRRRSVRIRWTAWHLVLSRILARLWFPTPPRRQLFNDDCLCVGHLRTKFRKRPVCHRAICVCMGANDSGTPVLGNSFRLGLCCASHPALCCRKIYCGQTTGVPCLMLCLHRVIWRCSRSNSTLR